MPHPVLPAVYRGIVTGLLALPSIATMAQHKTVIQVATPSDAGEQWPAVHHVPVLTATIATTTTATNV